MYKISYGQETEKIETRDQAIELARDISDGNHRTVTVEDDAERLVYRNGSLTQYLYDARKR